MKTLRFGSMGMAVVLLAGTHLPGLAPTPTTQHINGGQLTHEESSAPSQRRLEFATLPTSTLHYGSDDVMAALTGLR